MDTYTCSKEVSIKLTFVYNPTIKMAKDITVFHTSLKWVYMVINYG